MNIVVFGKVNLSKGCNGRTCADGENGSRGVWVGVFVVDGGSESGMIYVDRNIEKFNGNAKDSKWKFLG